MKKEINVEQLELVMRKTVMLTTLSRSIVKTWMFLRSWKMMSLKTLMNGFTNQKSKRRRRRMRRIREKSMTLPNTKKWLIKELTSDKRNMRKSRRKTTKSKVHQQLLLQQPQMMKTKMRRSNNYLNSHLWTKKRKKIKMKTPNKTKRIKKQRRRIKIGSTRIVKKRSRKM